MEKDPNLAERELNSERLALIEELAKHISDNSYPADALKTRLQDSSANKDLTQVNELLRTAKKDLLRIMDAVNDNRQTEDYLYDAIPTIRTNLLNALDSVK